MYRLKVALVVLGIVVIGVIGGNLMLSSVERAAAEQVSEGLRNTHLAYGKMKRLRDLQLKDIAAAVARSEVAAYMGALQDHRAALLAVERSVYRAVPGGPDDPDAVADRSAIVRDQHGELARSFAEDLANRLEAVGGASIWQDEPRVELMKSVQEGLAACLAVGVNNCVHRFTYFPLREVARDFEQRAPVELDPDLLILTDANGTGVADYDRDHWSDKRGFGAQHALALEVSSGHILRDVLRIEDSGRYYFLTAAPIFEGGQYRGSVLVGVSISAALAEQEARALGYQVGYMDGREFILSTLDDRAASTVRHNLPGREVGPPQIKYSETDSLAAAFVPITGNLSNEAVRVVIVAGKDATAVIGSARMWLWMGAFAVLLVSMLLLVRFDHVFMRPFMQIDAQIHEIIDGSREPAFKVDTKESLWRSLANSLNVMVATLTGRDLDRESEEWAKGLMRDDEPAEPAEPAAAGKGGGNPGSKELDEPTA